MVLPKIAGTKRHNLLDSINLLRKHCMRVDEIRSRCGFKPHVVMVWTPWDFDVNSIYIYLHRASWKHDYLILFSLGDHHGRKSAKLFQETLNVARHFVGLYLFTGTAYLLWIIIIYNYANARTGNLMTTESTKNSSWIAHLFFISYYDSLKGNHISSTSHEHVVHIAYAPWQGNMTCWKLSHLVDPRWNNY